MTSDGNLRGITAAASPSTEAPLEVAPARVHYHQKTALLHNIIPRIHEARAASLLDIGAGTTEMAVPLSRAVHDYCAIERDAERAAELRRAGLRVVQGAFPMPIDRSYDFVLSCHSVPERAIETYPAFLRAAWAAVSATGTMLVVTFKGGAAAVSELRRNLLGAPESASPEFTAIVECCAVFGVTDVRHVNSFAEASTAADLADFIGPWLCDQDQQNRIRDPLMRILEAQYRVRDGLYVFPTQHLFISCRSGGG